MRPISDRHTPNDQIDRLPVIDARRWAPLMRARSLAVAALLLVCWLGFTALSHAQTSAQLPELELTEKERAWLAEHPVIRIGVDAAYAPYAYIDINGRPAGMSSDILALLATQLGVQFELVPNLSWPEILEAARKREIDLITTASYRKEREEYLVFSQPYLPTPSVVMTRNDTPRLRDPQQLSGKRVALVEAYSSSKQFLIEVPAAQALFVKTPLEGLLAVSSGAAEAYVGVIGINTYLTSRNGISNLVVNVPFELDNAQNFGVRKDWPELAALLDKALDNVPQETLQAVFSRWVPVSMETLTTPTSALSPSALEWLQRLPALRVGVLNTRPPFEFSGPNGAYAGIAADTLELLRKRTGIHTTIVAAESVSTLLGAYEAGEIDMIMAVNGNSPGMPVSDLSVPYFVSSLGVFVPRGKVFLGDLGGLLDRRVAVVQHSFSAEVLAEYPRIAKQVYPTLTEAAQAVLSGDAEFMVSEATSALRALEETGVAGLSYAGPLNEQPLSVHIAVHSQLDGLRPLINAAISSFSADESAQIRRQWVGGLVQSGIAPTTVAAWAAVLLVLSSLGYLGFFMHNRQLRKEMALRAQMADRLAVARSERDEAENRFRTMVDTSPHALLLIGPQGKVAQVTASVEALFGYTRAELIGQPIELLVPTTQKAAHPAQRKNYMDSAEPSRKMAGGRELFAQHKNGHPIPVEVRLSPVDYPEGRFVLASVVDNTESHAAQLKLRESEERFRDLFENASDLIYVLDLSNDFVFVNASWCKTLGYTPDEANKIGLLEVIAPESQAQAMALKEKSQAGENHELVQLVLLTRDQQRIEVEGNITQKIENGKSISSRGVFRDVTARNRFVKELAQAKQKAEAADHIKSAFLASMSHELRTPLNSVIGFTGILLKRLAGPLNDEQAVQMGKVRDSARHLLALVNDVLDISTIEAGELQVEQEPFDIEPLMSRVIGTLHLMAENKGVEMHMHLPPALPHVWGDARRTEQVLLNLLNNALKFTETGSVTLVAKVGSDGFVRVDVIDTGIGISEDNMAILFQPFRQVDGRLARQHEGTGLGLVISRRLVELMGGELAAHSKIGQGSTFSFSLPTHSH